MYNFQKAILLIILIFLFVDARAQRGSSSDQNCSLDYRRAKKKVEIFLTWEHLKDYRVQSGTQGIPVEQVRVVTTQDDCTKLNSIINNNAKYKSIQLNLSLDRTKYFYRVNNFYFIFWDYKPDPEPESGKGKFRSGPRRLFIVVSKDFQSVWEFYI